MSLNEETRQYLDQYRVELCPPTGASTRAWQRFQAAPGSTARRRRWRRLRGWTRFYVLRSSLVALAAFVVIGGLSALTLQREGRMMARAESHMAAGEHAAAHRVFVLMSQKFRGKDAWERRMGRVLDNLCAMGRPIRAAQELDKYLSVHPQSRHGSRRDAVCAASRGTES